MYTKFTRFFLAVFMEKLKKIRNLNYVKRRIIHWSYYLLLKVVWINFGPYQFWIAYFCNIIGKFLKCCKDIMSCFRTGFIEIKQHLLFGKLEKINVLLECYTWYKHKDIRIKDDKPMSCFNLSATHATFALNDIRNSKLQRKQDVQSPYIVHQNAFSNSAMCFWAAILSPNLMNFCFQTYCEPSAYVHENDTSTWTSKLTYW